MKLVWAALIIVGAAGVAVAAMLLVRRNAPDGGYFNDGDRASGLFGVLATGFSVLLGFIVFLAFEPMTERGLERRRRRLRWPSRSRRPSSSRPRSSGS